MMIVSKLRLDFSEATWATMDGARTRALQLFEAVTGTEEGRGGKRTSAESPSLGELLYRALVERTELAS